MDPSTTIFTHLIPCLILQIKNIFRTEFVLSRKETKNKQTPSKVSKMAQLAFVFGLLGILIFLSSQTSQDIS